MVGPNGAGKSTFVRWILAPALPPGTPFVNADEIARQRWPGHEQSHAYEAADVARRTREALLDGRRSFIVETVASHPSKLELVQRARADGYVVQIHVLMVPENLAVARVRQRVASGGHSVPVRKIRERYRRLWIIVTAMATAADSAFVYDNSNEVRPRLLARMSAGEPTLLVDWPTWTPPAVRSTWPG